MLCFFNKTLPLIIAVFLIENACAGVFVEFIGNDDHSLFPLLTQANFKVSNLMLPEPQSSKNNLPINTNLFRPKRENRYSLIRLRPDGMFVSLMSVSYRQQTRGKGWFLIFSGGDGRASRSSEFVPTGPPASRRDKEMAQNISLSFKIGLNW